MKPWFWLSPTAVMKPHYPHAPLEQSFRLQVSSAMLAQHQTSSTTYGYLWLVDACSPSKAKSEVQACSRTSCICFRLIYPNKGSFLALNTFLARWSTSWCTSSSSEAASKPRSLMPTSAAKHCRNAASTSGGTWPCRIPQYKSPLNVQGYIYIIYIYIYHEISYSIWWLAVIGP